MFGRSNVKDDLDSGIRPADTLPDDGGESGSPWSFVRKIYSILSVQLLLTVAVAVIVVKVHPVSHFFTETKAGLILYLSLIFTTLICTMIYGCAGSILFCGYIVYNTDNLIKRFGYDEYIWASCL